MIGDQEVTTEEERPMQRNGDVCCDGHWYKPTLMPDGKYHVTVLPMIIDKALGQGSLPAKALALSAAVGLVGASVLVGNHRRG